VICIPNLIRIHSSVQTLLTRTSVQIDGNMRMMQVFRLGNDMKRVNFVMAFTEL